MTTYVFHQTCTEEKADPDGTSAGPPPSFRCLECARAWSRSISDTDEYLGNVSICDVAFTHCDCCGRLTIRTDTLRNANAAGGNWPRSHADTHLYRSQIKTFPIHGADVPIDALRRHLFDHYGDVRSISPQKAEELVLSVFREHYGDAEVRYFRGGTYTADEGIDIVVVGLGEGTVGLQVKRRVSRLTEPVMEIRSFVASLFLNGIRNGVYVALSSRFTKAGHEIARHERLQELGVSLKLVDADAFYGMLNSEALRMATPPWYHVIESYPALVKDPYVQRLLGRYGRT